MRLMGEDDLSADVQQIREIAGCQVTETLECETTTLSIVIKKKRLSSLARLALIPMRSTSVLLIFSFGK